MLIGSSLMQNILLVMDQGWQIWAVMIHPSLAEQHLKYFWGTAKTLSSPEKPSVLNPPRAPTNSQHWLGIFFLKKKMRINRSSKHELLAFNITIINISERHQLFQLVLNRVTTFEPDVSKYKYNVLFLSSGKLVLMTVYVLEYTLHLSLQCDCRQVSGHSRVETIVDYFDLSSDRKLICNYFDCLTILGIF